MQFQIRGGIWYQVESFQLHCAVLPGRLLLLQDGAGPDLYQLHVAVLNTLTSQMPLLPTERG